MKKGRFSGKKRAKRLFTAICATSDSTCEKSGLIVASIALPGRGLPLHVDPDVARPLGVAERLPGRRRAVATSWPLA